MEYLPLLMLLISVPYISCNNENIVIEDGVYKNIILGLEVDEGQSIDIVATVNKIKEFMTDGSSSLNIAVDGKASIGEVTLVVPRFVDTSVFTGYDVIDSDPSIPMNSADILFHEDVGAMPDTLQEEDCGVPGRQIRVPLHFTELTEDQIKQYGTQGNILAHEWAHFRYGAQDEHGFPSDSVYDLYYVEDGTEIPTSCAQGDIEGEWKKNCIGTDLCNPTSDESCNFCPDSTKNEASVVKASLGYLPALSDGKFCTAATHNSNTNSPQNILCGGRSIMELIQAHPDYEEMMDHTPPTLKFVIMKEALPRVMLLLDTPPDDVTNVVDYEILLLNLTNVLTKYDEQQIGIWTYTANGNGETVVENPLPFQVITDYNSLFSYLPQAAPRSSSPFLSEVFTSILNSVDAYLPGTMVVMPLTNELITEGDLLKDLGVSLHAKRLMPLLMFIEQQPEYHLFGSFLQWSGSKMLSGDKDSEVNGDVSSEIEYFLDTEFKDQHLIVADDSLTLERDEAKEYSISFSLQTVHTIMAVVTPITPGLDISSDILVQYDKYGVFKNCSIYPEVCFTNQDSIVLVAYSDFRVPSAEKIGIKITNAWGLSAAIQVTWSEITYPATDHEITVSSWFSDGRGPIADIDENKDVKLFMSVNYDGYQVLQKRVNVYASLDVETASGTEVLNVELQDTGADGDLRTDDSVFTYTFDSSYSETGTVFSLTSIKLEDHAIVIRRSNYNYTYVEDRTNQRLQALGLYSLDPFETECCGSYVKNPSTHTLDYIIGYNFVKADHLPSITIKREIVSTPAPIITTKATEEPTTVKPTAPTEGTTTTIKPPATNDPTTSPTVPNVPTTTSSTKPPSTTVATTTTTTSPAGSLSNAGFTVIAIGIVAFAAVIAFTTYLMYSKGVLCFRTNSV